MKIFALATVLCASRARALEVEYVGPADVASVAANSTPTVPAHYPYDSVEDFFTNSGVQKSELEVGVTRCAATGANEKVHDISDGKQDRCFVTITPPNPSKPVPVLFFAHGSGGNAANCEGRPDLTGKTWADIASEHGFAFVCGEALQYTAINDVTGAPLHGGLWEIPEVFTNSTGQKCNDSDSFDNTYMDALIAELDKQPTVYDTSKFFVTGCSMGSAFTVWQGPCLHSKNPTHVTAFASHSTGLKIKGDGLKFPPDTYNSQYEWGECPECEYWPNHIEKFDGLKACVFDNTADPSTQDPYFYTSSKQLVSHWAAAGNRAAETHYGSGGHCVQHSFETIADCLDDNTGRLIPGGAGPSPAPSGPSPSSPSPSGGNCTDIAPDTKYTCAEQKAVDHCHKPWMQGYCCKTCWDCATGCGK